jgi:hypothetical protein
MPTNFFIIQIPGCRVILLPPKLENMENFEMFLSIALTSLTVGFNYHVARREDIAK